MPTQNADLSLRQSITGANQPLVPSLTDLYTPDDQDDQDELRGPIPPILVVPPGMDRDKFIKQVEEAYGIEYVQLDSNSPTDQIQIDVDHALFLMDLGSFALTDRDFAKASDLFSLCAILATDYHFDSLLAMSRYYLQDFTSSLKLMRRAYDDLLGLYQQAINNAGSVDEQAFIEDFFSFYISLLMQTGHAQSAVQLTDFVIKNNLVAHPESWLLIARQHHQSGNIQEVVRLSKVIVSLAAQIKDINQKNRILTQVSVLINKIQSN